MNLHLKFIRIISITCVYALSFHVLGQDSKTIISEQWRFGNNNSPVYFKTKSKTDSLKNVYVVGATLNSQNNRDLIIQKIDPSGNLIWQNVISGDANLDDVGTDVYIDDQYNVYVTGTVNRLGTYEDLAVTKYSSNGGLIWEYYKDAIESESGIALIVDSNNLYVAGVTSSISTLTDYLTISLDATNGSFLWSNTYNYSDLNEMPVSILIRNHNLYITGASQLSSIPQIKWEIATIKYDASNGMQLSEERSSGNISQGIDEVHEFTFDNNGNIYIVGGVVNQNTGLDIAVYKLDNNLNLIWGQFIDENGLDDVAYSLELDNSGNIYITGYSTKQNEGKNIFIKKLDNMGVELWTNELKGKSNLDDVGVQLCFIDDTTAFITGFIRNSLDADFIVAGFKNNGTILNTINYADESNLDDLPTSICSDSDGNLIVTGVINHSGGFKSKTIKYEIFKRNLDYHFNSTTGIPEKVKNHVIVRFSKAAINLNTYANKNIKAGPAHIFLNTTALNELYIKTGMVWENLKCYKIHSTFGPNDSLSITRNGDTIPTNDFWTALIIETPNTRAENILIDTLLTIHDLIITAGLNAVFFPSNVPNDTFYTSQLGLYSNSTYPNADINVENAWFNEVGNENIKVGVIDYLVDYSNLDFGSGTLQGSKVKGYDCLLNQDIAIFQYIPNNSHGTAVAGIIGAIRNNDLGIAGIAGGDAEASNKGVSIYSFVIFSSTSAAETPELIEALALGNLSTTVNNGYGVHIQNMSFGSPVPNGDLFKTLDEGFKNGCVYVAARGNNGGTSNVIEWPACYNKDNVIMNVIASGTDGQRKVGNNGANEPVYWESSFGYVCTLGNCIDCDKVDFTAPGTIELIKTTISSQGAIIPYPSCTMPINPSYGCFNGTSAAAPHVTGTAALMMSKHQPSNGYPNILISEDLENILEKTAGNQTQTFSLQSGYGLIDAGLAVEQVCDPYYVKHIIVPITSSQDLGIINGGANQTVNANPFGVPTGNYDYARRYQCYWNLTETLPLGHNIIDYWKVEGMTKLGLPGLASPWFGQNANFIQGENLAANIGGNTSSIYGVTNIYKLTNSSGQSFWFPASPNNMKYVYSLHVLKQPDASVNELTNENVTIFPNPTNSEISIKFDQFMDQEYKLEIVDAIGKIVFSKLVHSNSADNIVVSQLKSGIYFCKLHFKNHSLTKTFIKTE